MNRQAFHLATQPTTVDEKAPDEPVSIWSHVSCRCIDAPGGQGKDGTLLDIWDCGSGARTKWQLMSDGTVRAMAMLAGSAAAGLATLVATPCSTSTLPSSRSPWATKSSA